MEKTKMSDTTSSLSDLKNALKETLEARGSLGQIKARIRAEIFNALDDEGVPKPKLSNENLIINELIREYLAYNGYRHAQSVFLAESGQPQEPAFHREFLASELQVATDPRFTHVPLLYGIIASLQLQQSPVEELSTIPISKPRQMQSHADSERARSSRNHAEPSPLMFQK